MTANKNYRKQLEGQRRAPSEHLSKIASELEKLTEKQDQELIAHWKKRLLIVASGIAKLERRLQK